MERDKRRAEKAERAYGAREGKGEDAEEFHSSHSVTDGPGRTQEEKKRDGGRIAHSTK